MTRCLAIICTISLLAASLLAGNVSSAAAERVNQRPNIVLLLADDLGYGELDPQDDSRISLPHIDAIAAAGIRFTDGYVSASYCAQSRAGLLTGRYQTRFGFESNPIGARNELPGVGLPADEVSLAEHLQDAGYATALIGKWHLGGSAPYHPLRHGFDTFFGFLHEGHYFVPPPYNDVVTWLRRRTLPDGTQRGRWSRSDGRMILSTHMGYNEPDYDANNPILRNGQPVVETEYLTDAITREAVGFIQRHRQQPFFLYVAYNAVHSPMQAKPEDMREFAHIDDVHRRIFAGMLRSMDDSVGKVMSTLQALDLEQSTLVFFVSDNGGPTRELTSSNGPLRDGKGSVYEGGIRVPFLVQWTGTLPAGQIERRPTISLDIFATAAAVAETDDVPTAKQRDGINLLPYLTGENSAWPHETLYWRMGSKAALRHRDWKLVRPGRRQGDNAWQLYDLHVDIGEQQDLFHDKPKKLTELVERWQRIDAEMSMPRF